MPRWLTPIIGIILTGTLSFSVWAATSVFGLQRELAVQQATLEQQASTLHVQQGQIAVFQNILGEIKADVKVIKAIMEERAKRGE